MATTYLQSRAIAVGGIVRDSVLAMPPRMRSAETGGVDLRALKTPLDWYRLFIEQTFRDLDTDPAFAACLRDTVKRGVIPVLDNIDATACVNAIIATANWPFVRRGGDPAHEMATETDAVLVSSDLVRALVGTAPPDDNGKAERRFRGHARYFEFERGALLIGALSLLCAYVVAGEQVDVTPSVVCVLARPGARVGGTSLSWPLGHPDRVWGLRDGEVDTVEAARQTEALLRLIVLADASEERLPRGELPYRPEREVYANPAKARQREKKFSLFRVRTLGAPPDGFGRAPQGAHQSGHRLDVRTRVRGHWRWQPYGQRMAPLHRLRWIAPHWRGPEDGTVVHGIRHLDLQAVA